MRLRGRKAEVELVEVEVDGGHGRDNDFADDGEFAQRVKTLPGPLELLVERDGRLRRVVVQLDEEPPDDREI